MSFKKEEYDVKWKGSEKWDLQKCKSTLEYVNSLVREGIHTRDHQLWAIVLTNRIAKLTTPREPDICDIIMAES